MPIITVEMWEGRTVEQKRALVKELTDAFAHTALRPGQTTEGIYVVIREVPRENWGTGGALASDT
jgi:4-oxalocrotonate tautomerase